jgi:hypothetical protein
VGATPKWREARTRERVQGDGDLSDEAKARKKIAEAEETYAPRIANAQYKGIRLSHDPRVDVLKDAFSGAMGAGGVEGKIGALAVEKAAKALGLDLEEIVSSHRQEIHHRRLEDSRRYEAATGVLPSGRSTSANPFGSTRRRSQHVAMPAATAYCVDIEPYPSCMYEWLSKPFSGTVCTHNAMWVNHTEIRCKPRFFAKKRRKPAWK